MPANEPPASPESPTDPSDAAPPARKRGRLRRTLKRLLLLGGILFLGLTLYWIPKCIDEAPFDDADLEPVVYPVPTEGNFATFLLGLPDKNTLHDCPVYLRNGFDLAEDAVEREEFLRSEDGTEYLALYWEPMRGRLARVDAELDLPHCEFAPPVLEVEHLALEEHIQRLSEFKDLYSHRVLISRALGTASEQRFATRQMIRFATQVSHARNGDLVEELVSSAILGTAIAHAREQLATIDSAAEARALLDELRRLRIDDDDIPNALRWEYARFRRLVEDFPSQSLFEHLRWIPRPLLVLPERSKRQFGTLIRALIDMQGRAHRAGSQLEALSEPFRPEFWSLVRSGNPLGRKFAGIMTIAYTTACNTGPRLRTDDDLAELIFALRIRELETGALPATLSALVPEFFEELPTDPFTDAAYRYDPHRRLVWGVGENGIDDGGVLERYLREPDIAFEVPGH